MLVRGIPGLTGFSLYVRREQSVGNTGISYHVRPLSWAKSKPKHNDINMLWHIYGVRLKSRGMDSTCLYNKPGCHGDFKKACKTSDMCIGNHLERSSVRLKEGGQFPSQFSLFHHFPTFSELSKHCLLYNITIIFGRCHRSSAVEKPDRNCGALKD